MKSLLKYFLLCLALIIPFDKVFSQTREIDSLKAHLKTTQEDTNKVKTLISLANSLDIAGKLSEADSIGKITLTLAEKLGYKRGLTAMYRVMGYIKEDIGDFNEAINMHLKAIMVCRQLGDSVGVLSRFASIGRVYYDEGNYPKALEYDVNSLKLARKLSDRVSEAAALGELGVVYTFTGEYGKAKNCLDTALDIAKTIKDDQYTAVVYIGNLGLLYYKWQKYSEALQCYDSATKINIRLGRKISVIGNLNDIAGIYFDQGNYQKAVEYNQQALEIARESNDKVYISLCMGNIGSEYVKLKKYKEAEENLSDALTIALSIGYLEFVKADYNELSDLYKETGQWQKAYQYYKKYSDIKDSMFNKDKSKEIGKLEAKSDYDKQTILEQAAQEKKDELAEADKHKQRVVTGLVSGGLLLVLLLAGFIFRSLRITRKQKLVIEIKSKETEEQKKVVEEKNKDITDSINYAKRIQRALLKEEEHVSKHLPGHFILFKPKDIVSGDFYWAAEKEEYFYFAAVDCTGHGVPGGFMSMLGMAFLNEIIKAAAAIQTPAEILDELRTKILTEFKQKEGEDQTKDGMDISLMRMNLKTNEIQWSGANNPLYVIGDELKETPADKQPIGYFPVMKPFTNHTVTAEKGSILYLFSDGYADQFGGPKGKKFKHSQFKEVLFAIHKKDMKEQKKLLNETFETWKGNLEQVDDILVIGIRV